MAKTRPAKKRKPKDLTGYSLRKIERRLAALELSVSALETPAAPPPIQPAGDHP